MRTVVCTPTRVAATVAKARFATIKNLIAVVVVACTLVFSALPGAHALQVTFPAGGQGWVSCKPNVLTWSAESTDPEYFSVELLNKDDHLLNGNFQIGNAVETKNGSALVTPNCIPPGGGYYLELVNASRYQKDKPQVFYTSPEFSIQPNTSQVTTPSGYSITNNGTQLQTPAGASAIVGSNTNAGTGADSTTTPTSNNATNATATTTSTNDSAVNGPPLVTPPTQSATANKNTTAHKNAAARDVVLASSSSGMPLLLASLVLASALTSVVL